MGKKRVHELAKELGFQNRDLIEKLQRLGFENIRSHSSTIDEEAARSALKVEAQEKRAKTDESRVSRMIIRRRPKNEGESDSALETEAAAPSPPTPSVVTRRRPKVVEALAEQAPPEHPAEAQPANVAPEDPSELEALDVDEPAGAQAAASQLEAVEAPPAAMEARAVEATSLAAGLEAPATGEAAPVTEASAVAEAEDKRDRTRTDRNREEEYDEDDEKPDLPPEGIGLSELDFAQDRVDGSNNAVRVAPPSPSPKASKTKEEEAGSQIVRKIDPSILKARLGVSKRPEPPKEWGKQVAASPVTELLVRTDASGKRREFVDVRKEAQRGAVGGKTGRSQRRREEMSAKDLLEHRRGQVYYPSPGRKRIKARGKSASGRALEAGAGGNRKPIDIGETIIVADLAKQMGGPKVTEIMSWLIRQGIMAAINQPITHEVAVAVAEQFGFEVRSVAFDEGALLDSEDGAEGEVDPGAVLRAPVVTVMGHVDHGKTTLLDYIRKANVAAGEAGGITQRIAGYQVTTNKGMITFLDTPGHAAFTAMRSRGADITDIVILVVAADDGVMPQTLEAIQHARAADVPLIIAVNKIDKAEANPDRVLQQLSGHKILVEEWGGDVLCRRISAKTGDGVEDLLELLALQAEILELRANPDVPARGAVVEAEIDKGRGPVATVLVQEGTLRVGDAVVVGEAIGKVRAMYTDGGRRVKEALPSTPVQILGLDRSPNPGDELRVAKNLDDAKEIAGYRRETRRSLEHSGQAKVSLQDLFARLNAAEKKELRIIVKAEAQGSVEALRAALIALATKKVGVSVIHGGVGAITESDVEFANTSEAIIVGYGVRPDTNAVKAARSMGVDVRTHAIIYEAVEEVRLAMEGLLSPIEREKYLGRAEVRQTFQVPKVGTVAGCAVVDGLVQRSARIRLIRDGRTIFEGKLTSLRRFKDDAREVKEGLECGMGIEKFNDIKIGDIIESFEMEQIKAVLDEPTLSSGGSEVRP